MTNKKKICVYMMIMLLSATGVSFAKSTETQKDKTDNSAAQTVMEAKEQPESVKAETEPAQDDIKANKETLEKAEEAMGQKNYNFAISLLSSYIESKPKKYEAYKLRGDAYYAMRLYKQAKADYQKAVELKTSDDKFLTGTKVLGALVLGADKDDQYQNPELGNLYARLMYAQKALNSSTYESSYQKAVEYNSHIYLPKPKKEDIAKINCPQKYGRPLEPQGVDKYVYGAIDDIEKGHYNEAIYKAHQVTSSNPDYYLGYYLTGVSLVGMDKNSEAIAAFEASLKYNPNDFESLASLGQIYYQESEKMFSQEAAQKSINYFKEALKLNPNCYIYYYYTGLNYLQTGDYDLAIDNFNSAIKYKTNDYNSRYYKLIAQYIQGDYSSVIDGTTRLLYRHVSNYNSVLYLRALAEYKQGYFDDALEDIEKIHINMNDIYNADVKKLSAKEKTLDSYLYYLKSQIMNKKGFGAKADFQKAIQNPVIARLANVEKAVDQYTKDLNDSSISIEDYNKYKKFYDTQVQTMLESGLLLSSEDVENQYDYIRTTFDNLGLSFDYVAPNYKLTTIDNYVYKKYGDKLSESDNSLVEPDNNAAEDVAGLKLSTDPSETLAGDKSSIALMLASHSLANAQEDAETTPILPSTGMSTDSLNKQTNQITDTEKLAEAKSEIPVLRPEANVAAESEVKNDKSVDDVKTMEQQTNADVSKGEPIIIEAPVQKQTETFEIIHTPVSSSVSAADSADNSTEVNVAAEPEPVINDKSTEQNIKSPALQNENLQQNTNEREDTANSSEEVLNNNVKDVVEETISEQPQDNINTSEKISETKSETIQNEKTEDIHTDVEQIPNIDKKSLNNVKELDNPVGPEEISKSIKEDKLSPNVVEKHARVNLRDFDTESNVIAQSPEGDEVVLLEPGNFISEAEKKIAPARTGFQNPNLVTDDFSAARKRASESIADIDEKPVVEPSDKISVPSLVVLENEKSSEQNHKAEIKNTAQLNEAPESIPLIKTQKADIDKDAENVVLKQDKKMASPKENEIVDSDKNELSSSLAAESNAGASYSDQKTEKDNWFVSLFRKKSDDKSVAAVEIHEPEQVEQPDISESNQEILSEENSRTDEFNAENSEVKEKSEAEKSISSIVQSTFLGTTSTSEDIESANDADSSQDNIINNEQIENDNTGSSGEQTYNKDEGSPDEDSDSSRVQSEQKKLPWYKRIFSKKNKSKEVSQEEQLDDITQETIEDEDVVSDEKTIDQFENSDIDNEAENIDNQTESGANMAEAPKIRAEKADVLEDEQLPVAEKKEKKKFTWWWNKDRTQQSESTEKKSKFSLKNLFSRKSKSETAKPAVNVKDKKVIKQLQKDSE